MNVRYATVIKMISSHRGFAAVSVFLGILLAIPTMSAGITQNTNWRTYPYHPLESNINFPADEGRHDSDQFPIEWWYVNFHLVGQSTGHEYGAFVAYYKVKTSGADEQEVRVFSVSDITTEKIYTDAQAGTIIASNDYLDLEFVYITNENEKTTQNYAEIMNAGSLSQNRVLSPQIKTLDITPLCTQDDTKKAMNIDTYEGGNDGIDTIEENEGGSEVQFDRWYTQNNGFDLLPFRYTICASSTSQQDHQSMALMVDMESTKRPLMVGGDGLIDLGDSDFSYYYSLTNMVTTGTITVHGITESVEGTSWMDHQWGNFIYQNPPPFGLTLTYEWFSMQLDNGCEVMVGDAWDRETGLKNDHSFTGGLNIVNNDGSTLVLDEYGITPESVWIDTVDRRVFSSTWHITEETKGVDLTVTPRFSDQVIRGKEGHPLVQLFLNTLLPAGCFWEGICTVTGTIEGVPVHGDAYAELTHSYRYRDDFR